MMETQVKKYTAFPQVPLPDRQWPQNVITQSPTWCSVDLRDGNQALRNPMNLEEKRLFFSLLTGIGFKEIEIGFPSASEVEYQFTRTLIEQDLIPENTWIQVLSQAKPELIHKTFESISGAKLVIFHLYNSTSPVQRDVVFNMDRDEVIQLAVDSAIVMREEAERYPETKFRFEYSPESFTGTELDFALEICEAVGEIWQPTPDNKIIINLPATVEMSTPNIYADMIEWFGIHFSDRESIELSIHTHNDRGTGIAATEMALLAGADRVEGTLFGFGERTGNADIVNLALNLFSQGIDPGLNFSDINHIADIYHRCTKMPIHPRHPYVGELVYTAFSGSHQDAIKKGMDQYEGQSQKPWAVPYLPIDPSDVGRAYEKIIQINSQSGKGGVAYIMDQRFGFKMPKEMYPEFGQIVQIESDKTGDEISPERIFELFKERYLTSVEPFEVIDCEIQTKGMITSVVAIIRIEGTQQEIRGEGNGPLDAIGEGLKSNGIVDFKLISFDQHALHETTSSTAAAYIQVEMKGQRRFGVGVDANISMASIKALISGLNQVAVTFK